MTGQPKTRKSPGLPIMAASRKEALAVGARFYLGKPCRFGHGEKRLTACGHCSTCHLEKPWNQVEETESDEPALSPPAVKGYVSDFIKPATLQQRMGRR